MSMSMQPADWAKKLPRAVYSNLEKLAVGDDWFSVYKTCNNTYAIYEDGQYEETISYLLLGQRTALLVDTGNGIANLRSLCRQLTDLPIQLINTHYHLDHVGSNYMFDDIAAFDDDMGFVRKHSSMGWHEAAAQLIRPPFVIKPYPSYFDPDTYFIPAYRVNRWVAEGDVLDLGGRQIEVIHAPGHSPDSICLLDKTERLLFVGDIFYTGSIYTWLPGGDIDLLTVSYKKVIERISEYDVLMPSHNEPLVEKEILHPLLKAAEDVRDGKAEPIILDDGKKKYDYGRFAFVTA